jgi:hypothetical protein
VTGDFLRREWGAISFLIVTALGVVVVPIGLNLNHRNFGPPAETLVAPSAAPSTSPSAAASPSPAASPTPGASPSPAAPSSPVPSPSAS